MTIKPCPWCGAKSARVEGSGGMPEEENWQYVECEECKACGPWRASPEGAIESWNRRPQLLAWSCDYSETHRGLLQDLDDNHAALWQPVSVYSRAADAIRAAAITLEKARPSNVST